MDREKKRMYYADVAFVADMIGGMGVSLCNLGICGSCCSSLSSSVSVPFVCRKKSVAARSIAISVRWTIGFSERVSS